MATIRRSVRYLVLTIFVGATLAIIYGVLGEFFIELARENGLYEQPSARMGATVSAVREFVTQIWFLVFASALGGLTIGVWLDYFLRRNEPKVASTTLPPPVPIPATIDYDKVKLLAPPFRYEITWAPENNLQIITDLKFVPSGRPKPDTRIPTFFVKNLTTDFLRNVRVNWRVKTPGIESAVAFSPAFQAFNAAIITDFFPSGSSPSRIPYKAIQLRQCTEGGEKASGFTYQIEETQQIEFIDPAGEIPICPQQVYTAAELYLTAKLAGSHHIATERVELRCEISIGGNPPVPFTVMIFADIIRPSYGQPGLAARLRIWPNLTIQTDRQIRISGT